MNWNRKNRIGLRPWLFVAALLVACVSLSNAQQITGSIAGTVNDSTGAMITTAVVKATNVATGFNRSVNVGSDGNYSIQHLPVGKYTVDASAPGFKKFVQQNMAVSVDQILTLNVTLTIGAETQTVEVTTAPPLVNTNTSELGRTVSPEEINNLPLTTRSAYAEISLTPGVQSNSASNSQNTPNFVIGVPSTQVIMNGGVDGGVPMVSYYLDGGINMTGLRNYGNPLPNPDALEEFRVETSNFAAQYGRMSGGVVTAVTKSGTNQFHGSVFEFFRNTNMNDTPWGTPAGVQKTPFHRNNFGATVGGPVVKDKAFFFFSYGGLRQTVGQQLTGAIVPTALERIGDFTQSKVIPNMPGTTTKVDGTNTSVNCSTPTVGCIPQELLDPTAANIIKTYIPLPNAATSTSPGAYVGVFSSPTNQDEYLGKFDDVLSDKDHLQVSYFYLDTTQGGYGGGNIPYSTNNSYAKQQNANVSYIHTYSGTTANEVWLTFTRVAGGRANTPTVSLGDLGSTFTIQGVKALPQLSVSGYFSAGGALAGAVSTTDYYGVRDVFSLTKGRHTLNIGGELSLEKDMVVGNLYNFGVFNFLTSAPTTTKNALADFVTGQVATMEQDTPYHGLLNTWYYAGFVQDNYRVTPKLTANLGLRYDVEQAPVESSNLTTGFVPGQQSTVVPSAPLGVVFPGDKGIPRGVAQTPKTHFSPRVGFALDPFGDGKTAVRAAAGIFYGSVSGNEWNQPANAQPFAIRQTFNSITSLTDVYSNPVSFPNGNPFPYYYNPQSPRFLPAASVESIDPTYKWPSSYQFNAAVEQQLPLGISLQTAYVGNFVRHVPLAPDANNPVWAPGATTSQASINARRPYDPGVLGQVIDIESGQTANYNSLQVSAHKPLTHNLMLNGFYVWSKSMWSANPSAVGLAGTAQNYTYLTEERGPSDQDRRNMVSISGIWKLDYYNGGNRIVKVLANGWSISPIVTFNSGQPINITTGSDKNADGYNNDRPNLVPGVNAFLDPNRPRSVSAQAWFNKAAFTPNGPGLAGGIGPGGADGNTPRDYLRAPGYRDIDLGISRDFAFERGLKLQLRADATNAFNMVSLNAPNTTLSSSSVGTITGAATPRLVQIGARVSF
jgi:hypothetical protein